MTATTFVASLQQQFLNDSDGGNDHFTALKRLLGVQRWNQYWYILIGVVISFDNDCIDNQHDGCISDNVMMTVVRSVQWMWVAIALKRWLICVLWRQILATKSPSKTHWDDVQNLSSFCSIELSQITPQLKNAVERVERQTRGRDDIPDLTPIATINPKFI